MKSGKHFVQLVLGALLLLLLLGLASEPAEAAPNITAVSAGSEHTCALTSADRVWCWGSNSEGRLGNGQSGGYSATPVRVLTLDGVKAVSAGGSHTCALKDGAVWCWGINYRGELGNGQNGNISATPVRVLNLSGVTAISAGDHHTCAVRNANTVWCWGNNEEGELGNGQSGGYSATPVRVLNLTGVKAIAAGTFHTCALTSAGTVWCWGMNSVGQLGNGTNNNSAAPVQVKDQAGTALLSGIKTIDVGMAHTCALSGAGAVWCWGTNYSGELGDGQGGSGKFSATPVRVKNLGGVTAIDSGSLHTCSVKNASTVWCWGNNEEGELGNWQNGPDYSSTPVRVQNLSGIKSTSAGGAHNCALTSGGTVWCWGTNYSGELGNGQPGPYTAVPVTVAWP